MGILSKILEHIIHPKRGYAYVYYMFLHSSYGRNMSDEEYIKKSFKLSLGYKLDLENPQTFNEKLQWLKLYDHNPEYSKMADKCDVKAYVTERIGEKYVIPMYGVWDNFDDIDFDSFPEKFVLKTTHDCGGVVICKDKSKFNKKKAKKFINKHLKFEYFYHCREWPYKNIKPRIIAEKFMSDGNNEDLPVYKFFCFDGEPEIIQVIQNDKQSNESIDYFNTDWELLDLRQNFPNSKTHLPKPVKLDNMIDIVRKLAKDKQGFIRVDLYSINGEIYFSEYTFFSDAGFAEFHPKKWDKTFGDWIKLPSKNI